MLSMRGLLRLASEAYRIRLAYLFDPYLAVSASQIEALPHQITAVYGEMLPRQPLRFLLADDPGAGKTIMAGLLIKELLIRGDLERCLIVAPGSLVEQWQDELIEKFALHFDILTRDQIEASVTGNPFVEKNRLILRLDMAARSDELKAKLQAAPDWDLIVCVDDHLRRAYPLSKYAHAQSAALAEALDPPVAAQKNHSQMPMLRALSVFNKDKAVSNFSLRNTRSPSKSGTAMIRHC
jgi:SNF2 family DNA or RNA helicase